MRNRRIGFNPLINKFKIPACQILAGRQDSRFPEGFQQVGTYGARKILRIFNLQSLIKNRAFTLIELLVVIAIMGMLAGMIFPVVGKARIRAKKAKVIAEFKTIELALTDYYTEYSGFPTNLNKEPHVALPANPKISNGLKKVRDEGYLDAVPKDAFDSVQIYRYYSCVDNKNSLKDPPEYDDGTPDGGEDLADSCIIYSVGPDRVNNDSSNIPIHNFEEAHADAYTEGLAEPDHMPESDNIYLILPRSDIRYKK